MSAELAYDAEAWRSLVTLHHRPAAQHYLLCYILRRWMWMVGGKPEHERAEFSGDFRFVPLVFIASTVLRRHGLDLGVHAEVKNPQRFPGFSFFRSNTIQRALSQCIGERWIRPDDDHTQLDVTTQGVNVVLEWSRHIPVLWSHEELRDEPSARDMMVLTIGDPDILSVLDDALDPLYLAPNRHLRNQLIAAVTSIYNSGTPCPHIDFSEDGARPT